VIVLTGILYPNDASGPMGAIGCGAVVPVEGLRIGKQVA